MTLITFQDGKAVMRDGKVGTEQACCCGTGCNENCTKTLTVPWSYKGDSGTITTNIPGSQFVFVGSADLNFVLANIFCAEDGKWNIVVQFCAFFPNPSDIWEARDITADADGCPPDGDVGLVCAPLSLPCNDSNASGSVA